MMPFTARASTIQLPQTGQTASFTPGDDGDVRAGTLWPSPRFIDNRDGTLGDSLTGLSWSRDASPTGSLSQGSPPYSETFTWQDALNHLKRLNAESYLGFTDWRLPNLFELLSLFNQGAASNAQWLTIQGFSAVEEGAYWSSTSSIITPQKAWTLQMDTGSVIPTEKDKKASVWPVRNLATAGATQVPKTGQTTCYDATGTSIPCIGSGQDGEHQAGVSWPIPRFSDDGNGTITDNLTGLIWASDAVSGISQDSSASGTTDSYDWQRALDLISSLNTDNYLGFNDWRLPNRVELASVVNYIEADTNLWFGQLGLPGGMSHYWSSGTAAFDFDKAWIVDSTGTINVFNKKEGPWGSHVWPVRGEEAGTSAIFAANALAKSSSPASALAAAATLTITTSNLPAGTVGTAYSQTLAATGGTTPYTWSRTSGTIPAGLSLNSATGEISGTPTAAASGSITFKVTDSAAKTASKTLSLTINSAPLTIMTTTLPTGYVGTSYEQRLEASGGKPPYTWSLLSGELTTGLSLDATTGTITGTPSGIDNSFIKVQVKDANNRTASKDVKLTIKIPIKLTTTTLHNNYVGLPYAAALSATGGSPPYTWSIIAGNLPDKLSLDPVTGMISGTPDTPGTSNFTIQVTDNNIVASNSFSINITEMGSIAGTVTDETGTPMPGVRVTLGITDIKARNSNDFFYSCAATPSDLDDLSLNDDRKVRCAYHDDATASVRNPYGALDPFTLRWNGLVAYTGYEYLSQGFKPAKSGDLNRISFYLSYYSAIVQNSGGRMYVLLKPVLGGDNGSYLAASSKIVVSTTTTPGWIDFDFATPAAVVAGQEYFIEVQGYLPWYLYSDSSTSSDFAAFGFGGQYADGRSYVRNAGIWEEIPEALSFRTFVDTTPDIVTPVPTQTILIRGATDYAPTVYLQNISTNASETCSFDNNHNPFVEQNSGDYNCKMTVSKGADYYDQNGRISVFVRNTPDFFSNYLVTDLFSITFNRTLTATTDTNGAYSFSSLPDGNYTVVFDKRGFPAEVAKGELQPGQNISLSPMLQGGESVRILTDSISIGSVNAPYSQTLTAIGGKPPYTWSTIIGALPDGLNMDKATGKISGSPSKIGDYLFTVQVLDADNNPSARTFTAKILAVPIQPPLSITPATLSFDVVHIDDSLAKAVTVTNSGSTDIAIGQIYFSAGGIFQINEDTCSNNIHAAGTTCNITVSFSPSFAGSFSDFLNLPTSDENFPSIPVPLDGISIRSYAVPGTGAGDQVRNPMSINQSGSGRLHDINTLLDWQQQGSPSKMTWAEADSYCRNLNLDGHSGWRLPNSIELNSIVHYGTTNPAINIAKFSNITAENYWTSTTGASLVNGNAVPNARTVNFLYGETETLLQSSMAFVLCARGEELKPSVVVEWDGQLATYKDLATGLAWIEHQGAAAPGTWEELNEVCSTIIYGGMTGWRAPTIKELASMPGSISWSTTPSLKTDSGSNAAAFLYNRDSIVSTPKAAIGEYGVRCVHGGNIQPRATVTPTAIDFGTFDLGSNPMKTVNITNTGGGILHVGKIDAPAPPFAITTDSCSDKVLTAGATCTITVQLVPSTIGSYSAELTISTTAATLIVPMTGTASIPAPKAVNLTISDIGPDSAVIRWSTDQPTTGAVNYGTTSGYGFRTSEVVLATSHAITLTGLTPGTVYHIEAVSANATGQEAASGDYSFVTQTVAEPGQVTAENYLSLQEAYNRAAHNDSILALNRTYAEDLSINRAIAVTLKGGYDTTTYTSRTGATILNGSLTIAEGTLVADNLTITGSDPNSNLSIYNVTATGSTISWNTDLLANSRIDFGETVAYGSTIADKALTTNHSMVLTGLKPGTTYHFKVTSVTPTGVSAASDDCTMATSGFVATTIAESGNVTVMEVNGDFNVKKGDGSDNVLPRTIVAKEYLANHGDTFDFLVFATTFDYPMVDANTRGFYLPVRNDVRGINQPIVDSSAQFGSSGKLQGTIDLGNVTMLAASPYGPKLDETVTTLNHEIGHRWGSYVRFKNLDGTINTALLGKDNAHWSYLLDSKGSLMYGNGWQDNTDGSFISTAGMSGYSPLDLYLMGMIPEEQVPPMVLIDNQAVDKNQVPQLGASITGTTRTLTIDDIIAAEGARIPDATESQKEFKVGFVLLMRKGDNISAAINATETLKRAWAGKFAELTRGAGKTTGISPSLTVQVDSPADGATTIGPDVTVTGTVINTTGAETGVMVNGVPATITGSRFTANHVPLQEGANTIEVKATDANGLTSTMTRSATAQAGHYLRITSNIDSGTGTMDVSIHLDGSFTVTNPTVTVAGPVPTMFTPGESPTELTAKLTVEGTYTFTASATGPDGQTYSSSVTVTVISKSQIEALLNTKWDSVKNKILEKDIEGAVTFFPTSIQPYYRELFTAMGDRLPVLAEDLPTPKLGAVRGSIAKSLMSRQETVLGQQKTIGYLIHFVKENGLWKLRKL